MTAPLDPPPVRLLDHTLDFSWHLQALCRGADPKIFFPTRGENKALQRAKQICNECPVSRQCLEQALRDGEKHGIFGGTSERERRRLRSLQLKASRAAPAPPPCPYCAARCCTEHEETAS